MRTKKEARISVLMPVHNAAPYLREAVMSVLAQERASFELLICDDASVDGSRELLSEFEDHPRVTVFENPRNLGVGATRNFLISEASGRYLTPCDADDIMLAGNLSRLSGVLDRHPEIGVVYADILHLIVDPEKIPPAPPYLCGDDVNKTWDLAKNVVNHAGSMIRTELVRQVGGYDETVYSVDDWSLWMKLFEITKFKYLEGEAYYVWQRHSASITKTDPRRESDIRRIREQALARRAGTRLA